MFLSNCTSFPSVHTCSEEAEDEEDFVGKAETDFWDTLSHEQKTIEAKEAKRREAMAPNNQPTPIPEEGDERREEPATDSQ